jgi:hypothetical protein
LKLRSDGNHRARNCGSEALLSFAERNIDSGVSDTIFGDSDAHFRPKQALSFVRNGCSSCAEMSAQFSPKWVLIFFRNMQEDYHLKQKTGISVLDRAPDEFALVGTENAIQELQPGISPDR